MRLPVEQPARPQLFDQPAFALGASQMQITPKATGSNAQLAALARPVLQRVSPAASRPARPVTAA